MQNKVIEALLDWNNLHAVLGYLLQDTVTATIYGEVESHGPFKIFIKDNKCVALFHIRWGRIVVPRRLSHKMFLNVYETYPLKATIKDCVITEFGFYWEGDSVYGKAIRKYLENDETTTDSLRVPS